MPVIIEQLLLCRLSYRRRILVRVRPANIATVVWLYFKAPVFLEPAQAGICCPGLPHCLMVVCKSVKRKGRIPLVSCQAFRNGCFWIILVSHGEPFPYGLVHIKHQTPGHNVPICLICYVHHSMTYLVWFGWVSLFSREKHLLKRSPMTKPNSHINIAKHRHTPKVRIVMCKKSSLSFSLEHGYLSPTVFYHFIQLITRRRRLHWYVVNIPFRTAKITLRLTCQYVPQPFVSLGTKACCR